MDVTLTHPDLEQSITVDASQGPVLEKSGWLRASEAANSGTTFGAVTNGDDDEDNQEE